jgi:hypothetical protein
LRNIPLETFNIIAEKYDSKKEIETLFSEVEELYNSIEQKGNVNILNEPLEQKDMELFGIRKRIAKKETSKGIFAGLTSDVERYLIASSKMFRTREEIIEFNKQVEKFLEMNVSDRLFSKIVKKGEPEERYSFGGKELRENPLEVLNSTIKLFEAKLPEEIYISLGTGFSGINVVQFEQAIMQPKVLEAIRKIDKMVPQEFKDGTVKTRKKKFRRPHNLPIALIGYCAYSGPEAALKAAEGVLKIQSITDKSNRMYRSLMADARYDQSGKTANAIENLVSKKGIEFSKLYCSRIKNEVNEMVCRAPEAADAIYSMMSDNLEDIAKFGEEHLRDLMAYRVRSNDDLEERKKDAIKVVSGWIEEGKKETLKNTSVKDMVSLTIDS